MQIVKLPAKVGTVRGIGSIRGLPVDPASIQAVREWSKAQGSSASMRDAGLGKDVDEPPQSRLFVHASRGLMLLESSSHPDTVLADVHAGR